MKSDAHTALRTHLITHFGSTFDSSTQKEELKSFLSSLIAKMKEFGGIVNNVVSLEQVQFALAQLSLSSSSSSSTAGGVVVGDESALEGKRVLDVISAFDMPRFHYDGVRKVFHAVTHNRSKFGGAEQKAECGRSRYDIVLQRLQRLQAFQKKKLNTASSSKMEEDGRDEPTEIVTIESLMGQGQ